MCANPALLFLLPSDLVEYQLWDPNILGIFKEFKIVTILFHLNLSLICAIHFVFCNTQEGGPTAPVFIPRT